MTNYEDYDPGTVDDQLRDKYGLDEEQAARNAGCWVDGHWGWRATGRLIQLANLHCGFQLSEEDEGLLAVYMDGAETGMGDDLTMIAELADEAEDYLNRIVAPDGWAFGWYDGEFFLGREEEGTWPA